MLITEKHARKKKAATADGSVRQSLRIASKKKEEAAKADGVSAVQELIARTCGAIAKDGSFDDAAKASYLKLFSSQLPLLSSLQLRPSSSRSRKVRRPRENAKGRERERRPEDLLQCPWTLPLSSV
jgi:hypothetical protein